MGCSPNGGVGCCPNGVWGRAPLQSPNSNHDQLVPNLLDDDFFLVEHGSEYDVIVGIGGFIQPVVEDQLFRVPGHTFLGRAEIEVDVWIERGVVGHVQLGAGVVVVFPVAELNQVAPDTCLIMAFVLQFKDVSLAILEAASGQLCRVVGVKVEDVEDVRVSSGSVRFVSAPAGRRRRRVWRF